MVLCSLFSSLCFYAIDCDDLAFLLLSLFSFLFLPLKEITLYFLFLYGVDEDEGL